MIFMLLMWAKEQKKVKRESGVNPERYSHCVRESFARSVTGESEKQADGAFICMNGTDKPLGNREGAKGDD